MTKIKDVQKLFEVAVEAQREAFGSPFEEDGGGYIDMWEDIPTADDVRNAANSKKSTPKIGMQRVFESAVNAERVFDRAFRALHHKVEMCNCCLTQIICEAAFSDEEKPLWSVWKDKETEPHCEEAASVAIN
jgi:hypothetical protein